MSKGQNSKKETKKKAALTPKEKKAAKAAAKQGKSGLGNWAQDWLEGPEYSHSASKVALMAVLFLDLNCHFVGRVFDDIYIDDFLGIFQ